MPERLWKNLNLDRRLIGPDETVTSR
ncbi:unnamed protein product [Victoria cruziana]